MKERKKMAQLTSKRGESPNLTKAAWMKLQAAVRDTVPKEGEEVGAYARRLEGLGEREKVWLSHLMEVLKNFGWLVVADDSTRVIRGAPPQVRDTGNGGKGEADGRPK